MTSTGATAAPDPDPEIAVRLVQLWLCDPCLDGAGGECHTPGCSLWMHSAPDIPVRNSQGVTVMGIAHEAFTAGPPAQAAVTPGRAAFEAYARAESGSGIVSIPWDGLADSVHEWWEASAAAVMLMAQATVEYAELQELRDQLQDIHDALAAAWPGKDLTEGAEALLVAALVAERDKALADLADIQHGAGAWVRETVARETAGLTAERDEAKAAARRDQELFLLVRTERDHLKAEVARLRELIDNAGLTEVAAEDAAWRKEQGL